ncbi:minor tail protein T [Escherichia coli]|nr:minor tail protein T [Escherichia coli]
MHFSGLTYTVLSLFFSDPDMHPLDFSLLNRREADEEPEDDVLMQKAQACRRRPLWPGRE